MPRAARVTLVIKRLRTPRLPLEHKSAHRPRYKRFQTSPVRASQPQRKEKNRTAADVSAAHSVAQPGLEESATRRAAQGSRRRGAAPGPRQTQRTAAAPPCAPHSAGRGRPRRTEPGAEDGRGAPPAHRRSSRRRRRRPLSLRSAPPRRKPFPEPPDLTGVATGERRRSAGPAHRLAPMQRSPHSAAAPPPPPHARATPLAARARRGGDRARPARGRGPGPLGASARLPAAVAAQPPSGLGVTALERRQRPGEKPNRPRPREGAVLLLPPPCTPGPAVAPRLVPRCTTRAVAAFCCVPPLLLHAEPHQRGARSPGRERRQHPVSQQLALFSLGTAVRVHTYTFFLKKKKENLEEILKQHYTETETAPQRLTGLEGLCRLVAAFRFPICRGKDCRPPKKLTLNKM